MKSFVLTLVFMISASAAQATEVFYCKGNSDYGTSETIQATFKAVKEATSDVDEGTEVPYTLLVTNKGKTWINIIGQASHSDVIFGFEHVSAKMGTITGGIYLDELNESSVTMNGRNLSLDCGYEADFVTRL